MSEMLERVADAIYPLPNLDRNDARMIARVAILTLIDVATPDALNRAGVPWTLEIVQALDAFKRVAQGDTRHDG